MEINKRYKFKENYDFSVSVSCNGNIANLIPGTEFILTSIGHRNVHYQIIGETRIRTLPKMFWDIYVQGEAKETVIGDSKLVFKFLQV